MSLQRSSTEMTNNAFKDTLAKCYAACAINNSTGAPSQGNSLNIDSVTRQSEGIWRFNFSAGLGLSTNLYVPIITCIQVPAGIRVAFVSATNEDYVEVTVMDGLGAVTDDVDGLYLVVFATI